MPEVIRSAFACSWTYSAQEPGGGDKPDIKRPPDRDIPEFENDEEPDPDQAEGPGAPPFTGEDVEDIPRRDLPVM